MASLNDLPDFPKGFRTESIDDIFAGYIITTAEKAAAGAPVCSGLDRLTLCFLSTKNGYTFLGSHYQPPPNIVDVRHGEVMALQDATRQALRMEGYKLAAMKSDA
jgi:hypothetical protein